MHAFFVQGNRKGCQSRASEFQGPFCVEQSVRATHELLAPQQIVAAAIASTILRSEVWPFYCFCLPALHLLTDYLFPFLVSNIPRKSAASFVHNNA